jgi:hypothetical protein
MKHALELNMDNKNNMDNVDLYYLRHISSMIRNLD